ncbi:MAG TPA: hypothetical protein VNQ80_18120 [Parapedobacter sp.]|uniref:hypothetical protein n=1 Tax=Parapedobacter sp. TaxID=1958893 RepID=UPI002B7822E3|nr:hypothetical protein [Parapedobacter sp.]HWK59265.1 hypothetical protein [Parapedobacter sp.]
MAYYKLNRLKLYMWTLLSVIGVVVLALYFFKGQNAVWGTTTIGAIIALIVCLINLFIGNGFSWGLFGKIAVISIYVGFLFELVGRK